MQAVDLLRRRLLSTADHWEGGRDVLMTLLRRYHDGLCALVVLPEHAEVLHVQGHGQLLHPRNGSLAQRQSMPLKSATQAVIMHPIQSTGRSVAVIVCMAMP